MKKNILTFVLLLLIPFGLFAQESDSLAAQIQLKTSVESTTVPLNREVVYHIELSWLGELDHYRIVDVGEPSVSNLELQSSGSVNKIFTKPDGRNYSLKRISFYFKPLSIGMAYIDGVSIQYEDTKSGRKGTLMAQRLGVKITDPVQETNGSDIGRNILIGVAVLFLLVVAFSIYRFFQQRKKIQHEQQPEPTLEEKYLEELHSKINPSGEMVRENVVQLSKLLNSYLSDKLHTDPALPEEELGQRLQNAGVRNEIIEKLVTFNKKAELNKFAGEDMAEGDFHLFYDTIEQLFNELNKKDPAPAG